MSPLFLTILFRVLHALIRLETIAPSFHQRIILVVPFAIN